MHTQEREACGDMATFISAVGTHRARKIQCEKRLAQHSDQEFKDRRLLLTCFCDGEQSLLNAA